MDEPPRDDPGVSLMRLLVKRLKARLEDDTVEVSASELEVVRKLLVDNSVTLSSIQRGDFGRLAQEVAEEFPFQSTLEVLPATALQ